MYTSNALGIIIIIINLISIKSSELQKREEIMRENVQSWLHKEQRQEQEQQQDMI